MEVVQLLLPFSFRCSLNEKVARTVNWHCKWLGACALGADSVSVGRFPIPESRFC